MHPNGEGGFPAVRAGKETYSAGPGGIGSRGFCDGRCFR